MMRQERICFAKNRRSQPLDVKIEVKETGRKIYMKRADVITCQGSVSIKTS